MWLNENIIILCSCIALTLRLHQAQNINDTSYVAAIVQYAPSFSSSCNAVNLYERIIQKADSCNADLVVLPDDGSLSLDDFSNYGDLKRFRPYTPRDTHDRDDNATRAFIKEARSYYREKAASKIVGPEERYVPCEQTTNNPEILSCAAKKYRVYVVLATYEATPCDLLSDHRCPADGYRLYGTVVVLDRNGAVTARYRKNNVNEEPWLDAGNDVKNFFTTDYNVTYELLYGTSMLLSWKKSSIDADSVIFITKPCDEVPLLVTVRDLVAWSVEHGKNLLVAGYSSDDGAGAIYTNQRDEPTHEFAPKEYPVRVICEKLSINPSSRRLVAGSLRNYAHEFISTEEKTMTTIKRLGTSDPLFIGYAVDDSMKDTKSINVDVNTERQNHDVCIPDEFCCRFEFKLMIDTNGETDDYEMKLAVLRNNYETITDSIVSVEVCIVLACKNDNPTTCARLTKNSATKKFPFTIEYLLISRNINAITAPSFVGPVALARNDTTSMDRDYTFYGPDEKSGLHFMYVDEPKIELFAFGMTRRIYNAKLQKRVDWYLWGWIVGSLLYAVIVIVYVAKRYLLKNQWLTTKRRVALIPLLKQLTRGKAFKIDEHYEQLLCAIDKNDHDTVKSLIENPDNYVDASWNDVNERDRATSRLQRVAYVLTVPERELELPLPWYDATTGELADDYMKIRQVVLDKNQLLNEYDFYLELAEDRSASAGDISRDSDKIVDVGFSNVILSSEGVRASEAIVFGGAGFRMIDDEDENDDY